MTKAMTDNGQEYQKQKRCKNNTSAAGRKK